MLNVAKTVLGAGLLWAGVAQADKPFEPSGSLGFSQTFYGNAGGYKTATARSNPVLSYQFAPKWSVDLEWERTWGMFDYQAKENQQYEYLSQPSATLNYNYGNLGDSRVHWSSSLMYQKQAEMNGTENDYLYGQAVFDFASYFQQNGAVRARQFALAPQYVYGWSAKGASGHVNTAGLALLTQWALSDSLSFTFNAYAFKEWYGGSFAIPGPNRSYSNAAYFVALAWLEYDRDLYKFDQDTTLSLNVVGGFDPYATSSRKGSWEPFLMSQSMYEWLGPTVTQGYYKHTYSLFVLPELTLTHRLSQSLDLNLFAGVKYANQVWGDKERDWKFQPQGGVSLSYTF